MLALWRELFVIYLSDYTGEQSVDKKSIYIIAALTLGGCQTNGEFSKFIPVDTPRTLDFITSINEDCSEIGPAVIRVTTPPQHGSISIISANGHPYFPTTNPRHLCNSQEVKGQQVWFNPDSGFVGNDKVSLDIIFISGTTRKDTYVINVH